MGAVGSLWHAYLKIHGWCSLTRIKRFSKGNGEMEWDPQYIHHVRMEEVKNSGICFSC
jgi:hypothetical protein